MNEQDRTSAMRPRSNSATAALVQRSRLESSDSFSDFSEFYSTIEELTDPFTDDDSEMCLATVPPLPPRKATLRLPAKPPYPSSAVKALLDISKNLN